jgi:uncharacterized MAPEG superfamily protein
MATVLNANFEEQDPPLWNFREHTSNEWRMQSASLYRACEDAEIEDPSTMSLSSSKVERMNDYRGGAPSDFAVYNLVAGGVVGGILPFAMAWVAPKEWFASLDRNESVLVVMQSFSMTSLLFLREFFVGLKARTVSAKAAFSPAAAQFSNSEPFEIVECNRIFQNHIESACIYMPAVLSAASAGADAKILMATSASWVLSRIVYRWGYRQENPLWRLSGTSASLSQVFICLGLFAYQVVQ